jgi:hypothetical protein
MAESTAKHKELDADVAEKSPPIASSSPINKISDEDKILAMEAKAQRLEDAVDTRQEGQEREGSIPNAGGTSQTRQKKTKIMGDKMGDRLKGCSECCGDCCVGCECVVS